MNVCETSRPVPMALNRLTMLCLSLMRVSGWQMAALPVPHGHAQCAISQTTARQAVAPQMCSYDRLSSEFQVCARHPTQTPVNPSVSHLCSFAVAEAGEPAHGHGVRRASFLAAAAQGRQRVGAALQRRRAERGRVRSSPWPLACPPAYNPSRPTARTGLASAGTRCRAVRRPRRATARTCSRSSSTRRRVASG